MSLRSWFGRHVPDPSATHWHRGYFMSRCELCGEEMIKLPGLPWRLPKRAACA